MSIKTIRKWNSFVAKDPMVYGPGIDDSGTIYVPPVDNTGVFLPPVIFNPILEQPKPKPKPKKPALVTVDDKPLITTSPQPQAQQAGLLAGIPWWGIALAVLLVLYMVMGGQQNFMSGK